MKYAERKRPRFYNEASVPIGGGAGFFPEAAVTGGENAYLKLFELFKAANKSLHERAIEVIRADMYKRLQAMSQQYWQLILKENPVTLKEIYKVCGPFGTRLKTILYYLDAVPEIDKNITLKLIDMNRDDAEDIIDDFRSKLELIISVCDSFKQNNGKKGAKKKESAAYLIQELIEVRKLYFGGTFTFSFGYGGKNEKREYQNDAPRFVHEMALLIDPELRFAEIHTALKAQRAPAKIGKTLPEN